MEKKDCTYIYKDEMDKNLKTLKRLKEAWTKHPFSYEDELFKYGDSDFYFYRFAISCEERETDSMLIDILYRVMAEYGMSFDVPDEIKDAPFVFVVNEADKRTGYRLSDFYVDDDVNDILRFYNVDEVFILRKQKTERAERFIKVLNEQYQESGEIQRAMSLKSFFDKYFGQEEYNSFLNCLDQYLKDTREVTGLQTIKFLSSMNLATQKIYEEKVLFEWDYKNYRYEILDYDNKKIQQFKYLLDYSLSDDLADLIEKRYITGKLFKTMLGTNEYAESFITSEWLFHSLKEKKNFDYTSVISGYLKSIEQLLCAITMLNINNECKIAMSKAKKIVKKAFQNKVKIYIKKQDEWLPASKTDKDYKYIDLISDQIEYMDSSIGTFEYFLRMNPQIFVDESIAETAADMVSCFRMECRNGYFHTHNLHDWDIVEKTRSNAIYLYYILLGACTIPSERENELGILNSDEFDMLCKKIRDFRHKSINFIFEYDDGSMVKLLYDSINNTAEYTDKGVEHYTSLIFLEVNDFSLEECERLDADPENAKRIYLTRESLPRRIFGVRKNEWEEILG